MAVEKEIRAILDEEDRVSSTPLELRQDPELDEHYKDIIALYSTELARVNYEKKLLLFLPVLKQKFITMYCSGLYTHGEIANILEVNRKTIAMWLGQEEIRTAIEAYQKEENMVVDTSLKAIRMKAVNKLSELVDSTNDMVAIQATREILDRTGHMAVQKQEISVNVTYEERLQKLIAEDVDFVVVDDEEENNTQKECSGD